MLGIKKKKCPSCKQFKAKPSLALAYVSDRAFKLFWREVNGRQVCSSCQKKHELSLDANKSPVLY